MSDSPHFGHHLTLAVLPSMNTGLQRGELLKSRWLSVGFSNPVLTVDGSTSKAPRHSMSPDHRTGFSEGSR